MVFTMTLDKLMIINFWESLPWLLFLCCRSFRNFEFNSNKIANFFSSICVRVFMKERKKTLWSHTLVLINITLILMVPIVFIARSSIRFLIKHFLEDYMPSLNFLDYIIMTSFGSIVYHYCWSFLTAIDKKDYIIKINFIAFAIAIFLYLIAVTYYLDLKTLQLLFNSKCFYQLFSLYYVRKSTENKKTQLKHNTLYLFVCFDLFIYK